ncbi:hypothetical protein HPB50_025789 [Hyalomma asiaticum]|uniref:Uncharacterized protein n=1 Tax=Hyalomma asiaticum TaxID=266040 RepID=A0ACB7STL3_HYAAI|nr:hypothetical protein HPB50_025789 [Hyalomma asiaticum]
MQEFAMSLPPYSDSPAPTPFRSPVENDLPPSYDDITNPQCSSSILPVTLWTGPRGTTYLSDCPAEKYIPIFLVMGGVFGVLKTVLDVCSKCRHPDSSGEAGRNVAEEQRAEERTWGTLVNCFLFAWYVAGCVWVYRVYPPDYVNVESPAFCDKTLYLFAFGLVTAGLLSLGLAAACLCCLTLFSLLSSKD